VGEATQRIRVHHRKKSRKDIQPEEVQRQEAVSALAFDGLRRGSPVQYHRGVAGDQYQTLWWVSPVAMGDTELVPAHWTWEEVSLSAMAVGDPNHARRGARR
jgi:hypothetical protein